MPILVRLCQHETRPRQPADAATAASGAARRCLVWASCDPALQQALLAHAEHCTLADGEALFACASG
jgi:hypothetical protein